MTNSVLTVEEQQVWLEDRAIEVVDLTHRNTPTWPLRFALRSGLVVDVDPRRRNFCQAAIDGYWYYFCILPCGKALLLARWRGRE